MGVTDGSLPLRRTYKFSVRVDGLIQNVTEDEARAILTTELSYSARLASGVKVIGVHVEPDSGVISGLPLPFGRGQNGT